jgi:hypothetical protein
LNTFERQEEVQFLYDCVKKSAPQANPTPGVFTRKKWPPHLEELCQKFDLEASGSTEAISEAGAGLIFALTQLIALREAFAK